jgi:hypothetical protein
MQLNIVVPNPKLPVQMSVTSTERASTLRVTDRMINVAQSRPAGGQKPGASFVQTWVHTHLAFTHPSTNGAERKSMIQDLDTLAPPTDAAFSAFADAMAGVYALDPAATQDGRYSAVLREERVDGSRKTREVRWDEPTGPIKTLLDAMVTLDQQVDALPKLPAATA